MSTLKVANIPERCNLPITSSNVDKVAGHVATWLFNHQGKDIAIDLTGVGFSGLGVDGLVETIKNAQFTSVKVAPQLLFSCEFLKALSSRRIMTKELQVAVAPVATTFDLEKIADLIKDGGVIELITPKKENQADEEGHVESGALSALQTYRSPNKDHEDSDGNFYEEEEDLADEFEETQRY